MNSRQLSTSSSVADIESVEESMAGMDSVNFNDFEVSPNERNTFYGILKKKGANKLMMKNQR